MDLNQQLEQLRYAIFIGQDPSQLDNMLTQEEYTEHYESQLERDPAAERRLLVEYSKPLLAVYRKEMEQIAKIEQSLSGDDQPISFSDEEVMEELYDEMMNLETEEEWNSFKRRFVKE
ncbi:hypothetical protein [Ammoniphilus resinae]|uniref:Uncharacterized protein n=1 Tax=Ammoniphilus resinae TaxID=861532 RepID=A0ABS4GUJ2_9BACL|nr:hypothetical protein [Ammoniphilus resinae]MBP1933932.1 hypothetical protein [Ammoniphilus resinae]